MTLNEIEDDCDLCPLLKEEICSGGMSGGPNGPVEPPCCSMDGDEDLDTWVKDYLDRQRRRWEHEDKLLQEEKEKKRKKEVAKRRQQYMKIYTMHERHAVDGLKKAIKAHNEAESFARSMAFAINTTNEMFGYNERVHTDPETDIKLAALEKELIKAQAALKEKQKECRATDGYKAI